MFYKEYDELSAQLLKALDYDYTLIREGIKKKFPKIHFKYMLDYLSLERLSYNSCNTNIKESFVTSKTLTAIGTPVLQSDNGRWSIDINHRFFMNDIYYGICIAKWFAEKLNLNVNTIDEILQWVSEDTLREYTGQ